MKCASISGDSSLLVGEDFGKNVSICITLWHPSGSGSKSSATIDFPDLLKRVFLVLSDMITRWPEDLPRATGRQLPRIIIDGHGTIVNATYPARSTFGQFCVENRHARLHSEEVTIAGYRMITAVSQSLYVEESHIDIESLGSLYEVWEGLRTLYWSEWETRRPG